MIEAFQVHIMFLITDLSTLITDAVYDKSLYDKPILHCFKNK